MENTKINDKLQHVEAFSGVSRCTELTRLFIEGDYGPWSLDDRSPARRMGGIGK
jgi:hypothetical protein